MKLAFYISSLETSGGAERAMIGLANRLASDNNVTIIAERGNKKQSAYKISNDVSYVNLQDNLISLPIPQLALLITARRAVKRINPDVVISFLALANTRLLASGVYKDYPVVVCERNDPKSDPSSEKKRKIRNRLYKHAHLIVGQTDEVKTYFNKLGYKKVDVIPNFLNTIPLVKEDRTKTFVTMGRLSNQKNQRWLIDAFIKSQLNEKGYKLVIYGNGELHQELSNFIVKNKADSYVQLHPAIPNILEVINKCYCFVLPSLYEGMPNALMEAMSMGLPCISTDCPCGGPRSLITHGVNGLLVDLGDQQGLIHDMQLLASDSNLAKKLGENALAIRETHSMEIISKLWMHSFEKVTKV